MVGALPYDLWVPYEDRILKIQVKSTSRIEGVSYPFLLQRSIDKASYTHEDCDLFALVSLIDEKIMFRTDLFGRQKIRVKPNEFVKLDEIASFKEAATQALENKDAKRQ